MSDVAALRAELQKELARVEAAEAAAGDIRANPLYQAATQVGPGMTRSMTGLLGAATLTDPEWYNQKLDQFGNWLGVGPLVGTPKTPAEKRGAKFGGYVGSGLMMQPVTGLMARSSNLAAPVANFLRSTTAQPVTRVAAESALAGGGALAANELAPGSPTAEMAAAALTPLGVTTGVPMAIRAGLRGATPAARQNLQDRIRSLELAGVPPTAQNVGVKPLSVASKVTRSVPGGISRMSDDLDNIALQIEGQVDDLARRVARGRQTDIDDLGKVAKRGIRQWTDNFRARWQQLDDQIRIDPERPDLPRFDANTSVPMTNWQRYIADTQRNIGGTGEAAEAAQEVVDFLRGSAMGRFAQIGQNIDALPYETLRQLRSHIGQRLASSRLVDDIPRGELKQMYRALSNDLSEFVETRVGGRALDMLNRSNAYYRAGMERVDDFLNIIDNKKAPEDIYNWLVRGLKQGPTRARMLRKTVGERDWETVVSAWLSRLGKQTAGAADEFGEGFSPARFLTNWAAVHSRKGQPWSGARGALFSGTRFSLPGRDAMRLARVARQSKEVERMLANPSGTADSAAAKMVTYTGVGGVGTAVLMGQPGALVLAGLVMAGARASSAALTNPNFLRWLARSTEIPARQLPQYLGRLPEAVKDADVDTKESVLTLIETIKQLSAQSGQSNGN